MNNKTNKGNPPKCLDCSAVINLFEQIVSTRKERDAEALRAEAGIERLKRVAVRLYNSGYHAGHHDTVEGQYTHIVPGEMDTYQAEIVDELLADCLESMAKDGDCGNLPDEEQACKGYFPKIADSGDEKIHENRRKIMGGVTDGHQTGD